MRRSEIYLADLDPTREFPLVIHWRKRFANTRGNGREDSRSREDRASRPSLRLVGAKGGDAKWRIPPPTTSLYRAGGVMAGIFAGSKI